MKPAAIAHMELESRERRPFGTARGAIAEWLFAFLLFAAVLGIIVHFNELHALADVARNIRPAWLAAGVALQGLTYVCAAMVWALALAHEGFAPWVAELQS
jgi:uncharacterized membrane protein YbhN (UPF0104 family)